MAHQMDHPFPSMAGGNINAGSVMPALQTINSAVGTASNIAGTVGKASKVAGAAGKAAGAINPLGAVMLGVDMATKGIKGGIEASKKGAKPVGAVLTGALSAVGLEGLYEDPAIKAKRKAEEVEKAGLAATSNQLMKNTMEMQKEDYSNMNEDGTMATKHGVVKKLGAITGTIAPNMSMAQYNSAIKFSAIAKNMDKPIMAKGVVEDWEEGLGKARFGSDYDPKKADIA